MSCHARTCFVFLGRLVVVGGVACGIGTQVAQHRGMGRVVVQIGKKLPRAGRRVARDASRKARVPLDGFGTSPFVGYQHRLNPLLKRMACPLATVRSVDRFGKGRGNRLLNHSARQRCASRWMFGINVRGGNGSLPPVLLRRVFGRLL